MLTGLVFDHPGFRRPSNCEGNIKGKFVSSISTAPQRYVGGGEVMSHTVLISKKCGDERQLHIPANLAAVGKSHDLF
jgi:hypothetical protein